MKCAPINWENIEEMITSDKIETFKPIITRIDKDAIESMKNENIGDTNG